MRYRFLFILLFVYATTAAQQKGFPESWEGNWKGKLLWYKTGVVTPQTVNMELRIHKADSAGWTWQIIYGTETEDNRPYILLPKDTAGVHWVIDEKMGSFLISFGQVINFVGLLQSRTAPSLIITGWRKGSCRWNSLPLGLSR
ncbi:MAG: hypothetical protein IPM85_13915 [Chitinophagaceae bacterium]|nr:hypothetical protein [Chitinophagaceae bacterium]